VKVLGDRDFAAAVVKGDPTKYRLVPPSECRTSDCAPTSVDVPGSGPYRLSRRSA
jgi:hypothetical protein